MDDSTTNKERHWPHAVTLALRADTPRQCEWAVAMVLEIARKLAPRGKVILVDSQTPGPASLTARLGVAREPGIVDVLFRGASFSVVASRPGSEAFFFLPLGGDPPPFEVLLQHPRWQTIAERLPEVGAHLITVVDYGEWLEKGPIPGFETAVLLNGTGSTLGLPPGARRLAELLAPLEVRDEPEEADAAAAAGQGRDAVSPLASDEVVTLRYSREAVEGVAHEEPEGTSAARVFERAGVADEVGRLATGRGVGAQPPSPDRLLWVPPSAPQPAFDWRRLLGERRTTIGLTTLLVIILISVVLWRLFAGGRTSDESGPFDAAAETTRVPASGTVASTPPPTRPAEPADSEAERSGAPTADPSAAEAEPRVARVPDPSASGSEGSGGRPNEVVLPYSVAIASYSASRDAVAQQERLIRAGLPVYVAPTPVRGVLYHRVYAGVLAERDSAERLMARLVRAGVKDTARAWDIRPARFAFHLGTFAEEGAARARLDELGELGVQAYLVPAPGRLGGEDVDYHVYAGGYETREQARPLGDLIAEAGLQAKLVERVGLVLR